MVPRRTESRGLLLRPHSCRLPCSLSRSTRKRGASLHRRRIFVLAASFISIGQQWTRDETLLGGEKVYYASESTLWFSPRVVFFPPPLSPSVVPCSSRFLLRSFVKGEAAGGINLREERSDLVESRRIAGVTGVNANYFCSRELSSPYRVRCFFGINTWSLDYNVELRNKVNNACHLLLSAFFS